LRDAHDGLERARGLDIEFKGSAAGVAATIVGFVAMVAFAFAWGVPEMFGLSFGWGWGTVNSGHTVVHAFTPKIRDVETRDIFLSEGEELVARYDYQIESGSAWVSAHTYGWVAGWGDLEFFHMDTGINAPTREEIRVVAPTSGFYSVGGMISSATGTFAIDWEIERAQRDGEALRFLSLVWGYFWLLPAVLILVAVLTVGLQRMG
jgi:hypothetical protein